MDLLLWVEPINLFNRLISEEKLCLNGVNQRGGKQENRP